MFLFSPAVRKRKTRCDILDEYIKARTQSQFFSIRGSKKTILCYFTFNLRGTAKCRHECFFFFPSPLCVSQSLAQKPQSSSANVISIKQIFQLCLCPRERAGELSGQIGKQSDIQFTKWNNLRPITIPSAYDERSFSRGKQPDRV